MQNWSMARENQRSAAETYVKIPINPFEKTVPQAALRIANLLIPMSGNVRSTTAHPPRLGTSCNLWVIPCKNIKRCIEEVNVKP